MGRVFTLDEAQRLMPRVKSITQPVFELATSLADELQAAERLEDARRAYQSRPQSTTICPGASPTGAMTSCTMLSTNGIRRS